MIAQFQGAFEDTYRFDVAFEVIEEDSSNGWWIVILDDFIVVIKEREVILFWVLIIPHRDDSIELCLSFFDDIDIVCYFPLILLDIPIFQIKISIRVDIIQNGTNLSKTR